jgi:ligand-binding sensor domain-containing protein/DNA-binding CsgD family transcriptional regulator
MKNRELCIQIAFIHFICFFLLFSSNLYPEEAVKFENISTEDGLSQSVVSCILQDKQGYIWFGTQDGLNRYDGQNILIFRHSPEITDSIGDNFVRTLFEDDEGFIWIGTRIAGLARFDPKKSTFMHYVSDPDDSNSLSINNVTAIQQDSEGFMWIGTRGGGINRFDKKSQTFLRFMHNSEIPDSLSSNSIRVICSDSRDRLWIGTEGGGLDLFDPDNMSFIHLENQVVGSQAFKATIVLSIIEIEPKRILVGTNQGIYILTESQEFDDKFIALHHTHNASDPGSISHDVCFSLLEDNDGYLWIGTYGNGLNRIHSKELNKKSPNFQIFRHHPEKESSLSHDIVISLYMDRSGLLWAGTSGGGVNKFAPIKDSFTHITCDPQNPDYLQHNFIFSIFEDRDNLLWVGTRKGLCYYSQEADKYIEPIKIRQPSVVLKNNPIRSILRDKSGFLWISTYSAGLVKWNLTTGVIKRFRRFDNNPDSTNNSRVLTLLEDSSRNILIGTERNGFYILPYSEANNDSPKFIHFRHEPENQNSISSDYVLAIYECSDQTIWIGTYGGGLNQLRLWDKHTNGYKIFRYTHEPDNPLSLSSAQILSIYQSRNGTIWIGTAGGGLNKLNGDKKTFSRFTERDGLINNTVYGILEDKAEMLWLSTNLGLSRFDPQTNEFINFGIKDELKSGEFNRGAYYLSNTGRMYFGGVGGITSFFPEEITLCNYRAPLVITDIWTYDNNASEDNRDFVYHSRSAEGTIFLTASQSVFKLSFVSLDFTNPSKNRYAYRLEGRDLDWQELGTQKELTLGNFKPGRYTLRIKGTNSSGIWNEEGVSVSIMVISSKWRKIWLVLIIVAFLVFVSLLIYKILPRNKLNSHLHKDLDIEFIYSRYSISKREKEILQLLLQGKSNNDIGASLFIAESTVKKHVHSIYQKLGVKNRLQIINLLHKSRSIKAKIPSK